MIRNENLETNKNVNYVTNCTIPNVKKDKRIR